MYMYVCVCVCVCVFVCVCVCVCVCVYSAALYELENVIMLLALSSASHQKFPFCNFNRISAVLYKFVISTGISCMCVPFS